MRLFIAIENENLRNDIKDLQNKLEINGRKTRPDNFHLTLKFIGEQKNDTKIRKALEKVPFDPFLLKTEGLGTFPGRRGKLLYLGAEKTAPLEELYNNIEDALAPLGIRKERREFIPHITVARDVKGFRHEELEGKEYPIVKFSLKESLFTKKGVRYRTVQDYPVK